MTAKIHHADIYGTRAHKYQTLLASDLESVDWQELSPNAPFYLFMPQEQAYREEYEADGPSIRFSLSTIWVLRRVMPNNMSHFQQKNSGYGWMMNSSVCHRHGLSLL